MNTQLYEKEDTDFIQAINQGFKDMEEWAKIRRSVHSEIIHECNHKPVFAVSFLRKGRSIVYEQRVAIFWSDTYQLGTSFEEERQIGRLDRHYPRDGYCYPFEKFKKSVGANYEEFEIDADPSPADMHSRFKYCPTFYLFDEYECPCCGKMIFERRESADSTRWWSNLDTYFCLDKYIAAVHVAAKAKPKRTVKLRRCYECDEVSLYTIPERIVENGSRYPWHISPGIDHLKLRHEEDKKEYEIALQFLQFRLWKKYRIKEPNRKSVNRAAERHYRKKQKKLTKSEILFFSTLLGAGAIRRAHERNYAKQ